LALPCIIGGVPRHQMERIHEMYISDTKTMSHRHDSHVEQPTLPSIRLLLILASFTKCFPMQ
jgi:hypothetical protein